MKRILWIAILIVLVAGCGDADDETSGGDPGTGETAGVLAAAVEELITVDHTFGDGPPPFTHYLLLDATDPAAGTGDPGDIASRPLTQSERSAIEEAVSPFGTVEWIDDGDEYRTEDLRPTIEGAVIIGVGEPILDRQDALAPVSLWCGGLCGTWLTYQLELADDIWTVTGIEGPIAIS